MNGDEDAPPFSRDALLAEACKASGSSDFVDRSFLDPLDVLLSSLAEAPLSPTGVMILRGGILKSLTSRLRAQDWFTRHPEILEEVVAPPLVVVGMMRSGTTLAQRLLAHDSSHYCVLGWEVGEPAPRAGTVWSEPDPRIADAELRDAQTREFFPDLVAIHPSYAREAEEEIMFLADAFLSHVHEASCDVPAYRRWLDDQDFGPAYAYLYQMLQLLQWQKKQRGQRRERWVLKTPAHLGYLETLLRTFPAAHVIHMHRDPVVSIPSGASLNATLWKMHADDVDFAEVGRQWIERMGWTNDRAMAARDRLPSSRFTDIGFTDLVTEPIATIGRVYDDVGAELRPETRAAMTQWLERAGADGESGHRYTPEQFGLSQAQIADRFRAYIDRFLS